MTGREGSIPARARDRVSSALITRDFDRARTTLAAIGAGLAPPVSPVASDMTLENAGRHIRAGMLLDGQYPELSAERVISDLLFGRAIPWRSVLPGEREPGSTHPHRHRPMDAHPLTLGDWIVAVRAYAELAPDTTYIAVPIAARDIHHLIARFIGSPALLPVARTTIAAPHGIGQFVTSGIQVRTTRGTLTAEAFARIEPAPAQAMIRSRTSPPPLREAFQGAPRIFAHRADQDRVPTPLRARGYAPQAALGTTGRCTHGGGAWIALGDQAVLACRGCGRDLGHVPMHRVRGEGAAPVFNRRASQPETYLARARAREILRTGTQDISLESLDAEPVVLLRAIDWAIGPGGPALRPRPRHSGLYGQRRR